MRQGLFKQEGRAAQVRRVDGRADNETQVKIIGQQKRRENRSRKTLKRDFQNKTGNTANSGQ